MRGFALIAMVVAAPFAGMSAASAMAVPAVVAVDGGTTLVSGGCGPFGHRGYYGRCLPNGGGYRACPYGYHLGRYGQRCWPN